MLASTTIQNHLSFGFSISDHVDLLDQFWVDRVPDLERIGQPLGSQFVGAEPASNGAND